MRQFMSQNVAAKMVILMMQGWLDLQSIERRVEMDTHKADSSERVQADIEYATITPKKRTDNQEERTDIPELESHRTDIPELELCTLTSVYDTLLLHRNAGSGDVDTA
ncbi:uncharacterized protein isoform X10 [Salmo salar]|uniref:Uncharacterized protein isoform X10 n=1 Tax=Salmo salar TaxID=8030 RepID=A0ABM3ENV7_SALSA|nr:uncharacterized protein LOC106602779 isoform X10 [Salmo salar]